MLLCGLLQARCHIDRVAHNGELKTPGVTDNTTEDLANMDPNPDHHRGIELPLGIPPGNETIECSGACQGPSCVVGRRVRKAKDNKRSVTNELVDDTSMVDGGIHDASTKGAHKGGETG